MLIAIFAAFSYAFHVQYFLGCFRYTSVVFALPNSKAGARIFFGVCRTYNGPFWGVQLRLLHTRSAGPAKQ